MELIGCLLCLFGVFLLDRYESWKGSKRKKEYLQMLKDMGIKYPFSTDDDKK